MIRSLQGKRHFYGSKNTNPHACSKTTSRRPGAIFGRIVPRDEHLSKSGPDHVPDGANDEERISGSKGLTGHKPAATMLIPVQLNAVPSEMLPRWFQQYLPAITKKIQDGEPGFY
jgi:hypothetical protein